MTILSFDSDLNTIFLGYLLGPAETPEPSIIDILLRDSFTCGPLGSVVIPPETVLELSLHVYRETGLQVRRALDE